MVSLFKEEAKSSHTAGGMRYFLLDFSAAMANIYSGGFGRFV